MALCCRGGPLHVACSGDVAKNWFAVELLVGEGTERKKLQYVLRRGAPDAQPQTPGCPLWCLQAAQKTIQGPCQLATKKVRWEECLRTKWEEKTEYVHLLATPKGLELASCIFWNYKIETTMAGIRAHTHWVVLCARHCANHLACATLSDSHNSITKEVLLLV